MPLANRVSVWMPITFFASVILSVVLYFATHCTDPGFIPRREYFQYGFVKLEPDQIAPFVQQERLQLSNTKPTDSSRVQSRRC